ncbi:hypothetical protein [Variovorax sp. YR216]|uniref:hypothetical protein n=1 Tax=Variovorax sp. YR216 TaxID=1882828 RepID=UPI000899B526|nr:hypothetical protein [Variovorax sp. YR216]SEA76543.1 putative DNA primase/helicase [Variovorax sp. YR216]
MTTDPIKSFKVIIACTGMQPPAELLADGRVHMFAPDGQGTPCDGWYVLRAGDRPAGAFGCKRKGVALAWGPSGTRPAKKDPRDREVRSLQAQLDAFSAGIARLASTHDKELSMRYAVRLLRVAERMGELGASVGLDDPLAVS